MLTISSDSRLMCEIERTLRRGANTPHTGYNKERVEEHKREIQEVLGVLNSQRSPLHENLSAVEGTTAVVSVVSGTATPSVAKSGASSTLLCRSRTEY